MSNVRSVKRVMCALPIILALAAAAALAAGCAGGSSSSSGSAGERAASAPGGRDEGGGGSGDRISSGRPQSKAGSAAGPRQPAAPNAKLDPFPPGRAVIYTADLRIRAKNVDDAAGRAKQAVSAAGGYVETESAASHPATSTITFKIPADRYGGVLDQLTKQIGTKLSLRQRAEDVTEEVADVGSRVRSAEATLKSFRKLLDRARTVGEVINVEQELAQRQADLEALQARQKSLTQRTGFATVSMTIEPPPKAAAKKEHERTGFLGGLQNGWNALLAIARGIALTLGWLLPFLAAAAVIAIPAIRLRRRLPTRHQSP